MISAIKKYFEPLFEGKSPWHAIYVLVAVGGISILILPWLFTLDTFLPSFKETGPIGDTINGVAGPFIALTAALITFLAFWAQFKSNLAQKDQFGSQAKDIAIERFENKFYAMIEIHRNNINEVRIGKTTAGRKAFVSMFNELKFTHLLVKDFFASRYRNDFPNAAISEEALFNISYIIFFFGVGPNSSLLVTDLIGEEYAGFFANVEVYIKEHQRTWRTERKGGRTIAVNCVGGVFELDIKYMPCNGHMSRLSHYVRHLYQLVKYVDDVDEKLMDYNTKYNYVATLRSQLSTHEQLLLYYNAVSVLGLPWIQGNNLLKKYCLVKSIPLPLTTDLFTVPIQLLGRENEQGKTMFEWIEIKERLTQH